MRTSRDRDAQTLLIAEALGVFALTLAAAALVLVSLHLEFGVGGRRLDAALGWVALAVGSLAVVRLTRRAG